MTGDGGGSNIHAQHLCENLETLLGNAGRSDGTLFVDHQEVPCRVNTALHHDHVAVGRELVNVTFGGDVGHSDAAAVAADECPHQTRPTHGHRMKFETQTGLEGFHRRLGEFRRVKQHVAHAGQMDANLVAPKNVDRVYWHGLITTLVLEF